MNLRENALLESSVFLFHDHDLCPAMALVELCRITQENVVGRGTPILNQIFDVQALAARLPIKWLMLQDCFISAGHRTRGSHLIVVDSRKFQGRVTFRQSYGCHDMGKWDVKLAKSSDLQGEWCTDHNRSLLVP